MKHRCLETQDGCTSLNIICVSVSEKMASPQSEALSSKQKKRRSGALVPHAWSKPVSTGRSFEDGQTPHPQPIACTPHPVLFRKAGVGAGCACACLHHNVHVFAPTATATEVRSEERGRELHHAGALLLSGRDLWIGAALLQGGARRVQRRRDRDVRHVRAPT